MNMKLNKRLRRLFAVLLFGCVPFMAMAQKMPIPETVLKLDAGVSFITSKVYVYNFSDEGVHVYRWKPEFSAKFDFEHYWKSGWGVGFNIIYNNTSFDGGIDRYFIAPQDYLLQQWYVGPCGNYRLRLGDKWQFSASVGLGYAHCWEELNEDYKDNYGGLGIMEKAGLEYMLSPHVGLGLELTELMTFLNRPDTAKERQSLYNDDSSYDFNGFFHLGLMAGVRFYFP